VTTTPPRRPLTPDQLLLLQLIAAGDTQRQIARHLRIHQKTICTRIRRLYRTLGATNAPHAVALGYQRGHLTLTGDNRRDTAA
jgi:DNA-binding NarL/FixJ family response regulator